MSHYCDYHEKISEDQVFRGEDGHMYYYPKGSSLPVRVDKTPLQIVRDVVEVPSAQKVVWGGSGKFIMTPNSGRVIRYILRIKHPTIRFSRILEKISMTTNGYFLQSFPGKSMVIYNMIHHPKHYHKGLLVLPFIPYGLGCGLDTKEKLPGHFEFYSSTTNLSQESHMKYDALLKLYLESILIPDIAYIVNAFLGFQHKEPEHIDMNMLVYTQKTFDAGLCAYNLTPPPPVYRYIQCLRVSEQIIPVQGPHYQKGLKIRYENPLSQICIAFWKKGCFPNFAPVLRRVNFQVKDIIQVHSDHKKSLIYDKFMHEIHVDEKNPIYTITFSNPSVVENFKMMYEGSHKCVSERKNMMRHREVIEQLPKGTLFMGLNCGGWLDIHARLDSSLEMMMGVWLFEIMRLEFNDQTSTPRRYSYQKENIFV